MADRYDLVFVDGEFVHGDDARLSIRSHVVSYGTGTFEGLRATWSEAKEELYVLDPLAKYERFRRSANALGLPLLLSPDELVEATVELLRRNDVRADVYIRPLLFLAGETLHVRMHDIEARLAIYAVDLPAAFGGTNGVRAAVSSWRRIPDECMPVRAKIIGGYVNPGLAKTDAVGAGFDEAIMLTADGSVAEATTANVVLRRGDEWITPPVTDDILEGTTLQQVITLIRRELGERVVQRTVDRSELYVCDEALLCGNAVQIVPLVEVDRRRIGDAMPGERTQRLREILASIAVCEYPGYEHWTTSVHLVAGTATAARPISA
jgi:branched-chain amino acid aminotransferase